MAKFRKKPVVIEAWKWDFNPEQEDSPTWMDDALAIWPKEGGAAFWPDGTRDGNVDWGNRAHIAIITKEGTMRAVPGDWIIKGIQGELYPCKPGIFAATYEPA